MTTTADGLRDFVEDISSTGMTNGEELLANYIECVIEIENKLQTKDMSKGTKIVLIFDAIPRQNNCFDLITTYQKVIRGRMKFMQPLIRFSFLKGSMNTGGCCFEEL